MIDAVSSDASIEKKLVKREVSTLKRRHGKAFFDQIHYYDGFCNVPSHFDFQPVVGNHYNRYAAFNHTASSGDCVYSLAFVKHIFGAHLVKHKDQTTPQYELGLDYLQLLINEPTHLLTKAMTSQVSVEDTPQYRALEKSHKALKLELDKYNHALRPFSQKFANEAMPLADGGTVRLDNDLEALQYILNTFKLS